MTISAPFLIRVECPPGACSCNRDALLNDAAADMRVLRLTREEEKKLIARIEHISTYAELRHLAEGLQTQLGVSLQIAPGSKEVRTVRGLSIVLAEQAGLCKKTRQSVPAAIRRCLEKNPAMVYALLNAHDLLDDARLE